MSANPFAPPLADVQDLPDPDPGTLASPRRPLAVWTFQVLAAIAACVLAWMAFMNALGVRTRPESAGEALAVAILLATIVGSQRRWRTARWTGLAWIALVFGVMLWANDGMIGSMPREHPDHFGRTVSDIVFLALFAALTLAPTAFWFWSFGFSAKAQAWFAPRGARSRASP